MRKDTKHLWNLRRAFRQPATEFGGAFCVCCSDLFSAGPRLQLEAAPSLTSA
jgi:hypothetical protein